VAKIGEDNVSDLKVAEIGDTETIATTSVDEANAPVFAGALQFLCETGAFWFLVLGVIYAFVWYHLIRKQPTRRSG